MYRLILVLPFLCAVAVSVKQPSYTISTHLRGSEVSSFGPSPAPALDRGDRGHFYYADGCEDCFYKAPQCGCQQSMEYLACLTKHCFSSNRSRFEEKCSKHSDDCSADLNIDCRGPDTVCRSKFHQLATGGLGLSLDLEGAWDDAFCGPYGKCIGEIHMKANIHNAPQWLSLPGPAPAPAAPVSAVVPSGIAHAPAPAAPSSPSAPAAPAAPAASPIWFECGLANRSNARIDIKSDWILCQAEVTGDKAGCDIPMSTTLKASKDREAYCLLTDGQSGERLTQPAYHQIVNAHDKSKPAEKASAWPFAVPSWNIPSSFTLPWMKDKEARQDSKAKKPVEEPEEKGATEEEDGKGAMEKPAASKKDKDAPTLGEKGYDAERPPWMQGKSNDKASMFAA